MYVLYILSFKYFSLMTKALCNHNTLSYSALTLAALWSLNLYEYTKGQFSWYFD